jgi:hypothetical protein
MARSNYIYILFRENNDGTNIIVGAFTVKHELMSYIEQIPGTYTARRYRDGRPAEGTTPLTLV